MAKSLPEDMTDVQISEKGLEAVSPGDRGKIPSGFGDKKKVIILAALGTVAAAVVIWQFASGDSPQAAAASTTASKAAGASAPTMGAAAVESALKQFDTASAQDSDGLSVERVEALVRKFDTYVQERQVPLAGLRVNPFEVTQAAAAKAERKTEDVRSDAAAEAEARRQQVLAAAADLKLGAILIAGAERTAMIGGKLYHVGDEVGGLRVVAIESDRVTLALDDERISLRLRPDA